MSPEHQELVEEIDADAEVAFGGGRKNNLSDLVCSIGAIVGSSIATVLVSLGSEPKWITVVVAAVPGLCASLPRVVDFRGRAAWYFIKASQLRDLSRSVKYQTMQVQDAAKRFGEIDKAMEERWSEFVKAGSPPPSKPDASF